MRKKIYDIAILGAGVSGAFALYKLSKYKDLKTCIIDFGRPPGKRRKQLQGWFGCFPYSNARLYFDDYKNVSKKTGIRAASKANRFVQSIMEEHGPIESFKKREPSKEILNNIDRLGYHYLLNNFCQWKPENIHSLSRRIALDSENKNINFSFDNNIDDIDIKNNLFYISTEKGLIISKKIIFAIGRSGWRFARDIYEKFKIIKNDNVSFFGFRGEVSCGMMSNWNHSHCTIYNDNLNIGPMSWNGTVIPEDHYDLAISSWRSNEDRWKSDKVSFSVISKKIFNDKGIEQTERLGKLAFILSDNRIGRMRIKDYFNQDFDISYIPEYDWFKDTMKDIEDVIPGFLKKGYFYIPEIKTTIPNIKINNKLSTEIENFYVAGESAGIDGILGAAISGCIAADNSI